MRLVFDSNTGFGCFSMKDDMIATEDSGESASFARFARLELRLG